MPDMNETDEAVMARLRYLLTVMLVLMMAGGIADLVLDRPKRMLSAHMLLEVGLIVTEAVTVAFLWRGWFTAERRLGATRAELSRHVAERDAWRAASQAAIDGLRSAITVQFDAWALTDAERDVAMRLLQGESHKVIAHRTGRSERTVRQHAVTVYQKSGLRGRAELAAFFLDGLLAPRNVDDTGTGSVQ